jgi:hypothetical protein
MMRWLLLVAVLVGYAATTDGQGSSGFQKPDYGKVEKITRDPKHKLYYPNLYNRYRDNDTTLNVDDFYLLYYGYFFQDAYFTGGGAGAYKDSIKAIGVKRDYSFNERAIIIRCCKNILKAEPFNIEFIDRLFSTCREHGDTATSRLYLHKLEMLAQTVFSTGDGKTDSTGIHVLAFNDETAIVKLLGLTGTGIEPLIAKGCHYITLKPNYEYPDGIYFDVTQIARNTDKVFEHENGANIAPSTGVKGVKGK